MGMAASLWPIWLAMIEMLSNRPAFSMRASSAASAAALRALNGFKLQLLVEKVQRPDDRCKPDHRPEKILIRFIRRPPSRALRAPRLFLPDTASEGKQSSLALQPLMSR